MKLFTHQTIAMIRAMRREETMADICSMFPLHTRDEIVEAIDAILRHEGNHEAMRHVNNVLFFQEQGAPLINGRAAIRRPEPMF